MVSKENTENPLIEKLRTTLEQKGLSPERAAPFLEVHFRTLYRWFNYESVPTKLYRKAIETGIRRIEKLRELNET